MFASACTCPDEVQSEIFRLHWLLSECIRAIQLGNELRSSKEDPFSHISRFQALGTFSRVVGPDQYRPWMKASPKRSEAKRGARREHCSLDTTCTRPLSDCEWDMPLFSPEIVPGLTGSHRTINLITNNTHTFLLLRFTGLSYIPLYHSRLAGLPSRAKAHLVDISLYNNRNLGILPCTAFIG